ncbi:MAG: PIG-L deacetylase family protein [Anaerolineales bacterium]
MKFNLESAEIYFPNDQHSVPTLYRTTHLGIGAHQDDLEIMALDGILKCFQREDRWFCGVVVTDGSGSPRDGLYQDYSDDEMRLVRIKEQKKAAVVGEYLAQFFLDYPSSVVKQASEQNVVKDLRQVINAATPDVIYTHNLLDKHDTHVAVTLRVIEAVRGLPNESKPKKLFGCEVWRDLDWMLDDDKVFFDVSDHENLHSALLGVFDSQIAGGKRYDLATMGRRRAHATYFASHGLDITTSLIYAVDLTPLIADKNLDINTFINGYIHRFANDAAARLEKLS